MNEHPTHDDQGLAVEELDKQKIALDPDKPLLHTATLMEIFGFDGHVLATNRSGFATRDQKAMLEGELKSDADGMWLMVSSLLGVSVLIAFILTMTGQPMLPLVIGGGVILLPLLWYAYQRQTGIKQDTNRLHVRSFEGIPRVSYSDYHHRGKLYIGYESFDITQQQARALNEFALPPMRAYFAQNSKELLSLEVLSEPDIEKLKVEDLADEDDRPLIATRRDYDERQA